VNPPAFEAVKIRISLNLVWKFFPTLGNQYFHMQDYTRRNILSSGILALGALTTRPLLGATPLGQSSLDWIATLEERLRSFSAHTSRNLTATGVTELHCEMHDLTAFGSCHGNFAGLAHRVVANGNRISLERDGVRVCIVLIPRSVPTSFLA
jgi:hypothetical protein